MSHLGLLVYATYCERKWNSKIENKSFRIVCQVGLNGYGWIHTNCITQSYILKTSVILCKTKTWIYDFQYINQVTTLNINNWNFTEWLDLKDGTINLLFSAEKKQTNKQMTSQKYFQCLLSLLTIKPLATSTYLHIRSW